MEEIRVAACGRGGSRHSFDFEIYRAVDLPSLGRDVEHSPGGLPDSASSQLISFL